MTISIRSLSANDFDAWLEMWKGYQEFYKVTLDDDVTECLWHRLLSKNHDGPICYVAEDNSNLIGLVQFLYHGTTWSPKKRIYLHDLYTKPESRGKGVGRALIERVYEDGRLNDVDQVYWLTQDFNIAGRALYDKVADVTPFIKYSKKV